MHTNRNLKRTGGALLAVAILTLATLTEARAPDYEAVQGNDVVAVISLAAAHASRGDPYDAASADAYQWLYTRMDGGPVKEVFTFLFSAYYNGPSGYAFMNANLSVNDEWELPFPDPAGRPQELAYAGQRHFEHYSHGTSVVVGGGTYYLAARGTVDLDFSFAGRSYSRADTELAGALKTRMMLEFRMTLPHDITIEYGQVVKRFGGNQVVEGPRAHFASYLSCDLNTSDYNMTGSWSRMQQGPWALHLNLLRTVSLFGHDFTSVHPIVNQDFPAVDEYLFDRRQQPVLRSPFP